MALDIFLYRNIIGFIMARAATTSDAFNAIAEPRRREILTLLVVREHAVGEIVTALAIDQPSVSKHLRVLRDTGLVRMRCQGRQKFYRTNAEAIRPMHEWTATFERYWSHQLLRVKVRAEAKASKIAESDSTKEEK
jgi:DNA-binding transcriptional ArsR family regulator